MLDQPAQTVGGFRCQRIAECRSLPFDVVRGAEQFVTRRGTGAECPYLASGAVEPVALRLHPLAEFSRELGKCRFGARNGLRIGRDLAVGHRHHAAELVRRHDQIVIAECSDGRCV